MYKEPHENLYKRIQDLEEEIKELKQNIATKSGLIQHFLQNFKKDTQDFLSVIDSEFTLIEVNEDRLQNLGKNRHEIIGNKCYNAFYGLEYECEECTVKQVIKSKQAGRFLKSYYHQDTIKLEEKSVSPDIDEMGAVKRLVVESRDISNYFQLIDKPGKHDQIYKNIFEAAGYAFLIHDDKGSILEYGLRLPEMLGYSEEEFRNITVADIGGSEFSLGFEKQSKNENHILFETELIKKSGDCIPVEISTNSIPLERQRIVFVSVRNIEQRKQAEDKLRLSEKKFRTLVENANDLIMRFDRQHRHLFVNSASAHILNIKPEEFLGKTHEEMGFPRDKCTFWRNEMNKVFTSSKSRFVEFSLTINGKEKYFEWHLIPEFEEDGETLTLLAIARDTTVRKLNEQALKKAIQSKDKFFSIIAHDLKNPFNVMLPMVRCLKENRSSMTENQVTEVVSMINDSVKQEYNLLTNLLEWARSQTGSIVKKPQKINIKELLDSNLLLHQANAENKEISITVNTSKYHYAFADEYMIDAVIRNLISNALKFTHKNGKVDVRIDTYGKEIMFSVSDNGIGISKKNQEKLFRIDTNYNSVGTNEESGTGLGLILCKEFIEKNGGSIALESTEGVGSKFTFRLPIAN